MFYVYAYLDPRKPGDFTYDDIHFEYEPFYIGKGAGDRMFAHLRDSSLQRGNMHKNRKILQIQDQGQEPILQKIAEDLSEKEAWDLENQLITSIGRRIDKTGSLTNIKEGGQGGFSHINQAGLKSFWIHKYGEEEGTRRYEEYDRKRQITLERMNLLAHTPEALKKAAESRKKTMEENPEIKAKISRSLRAYYQEHTSARKGAVATEETRQKMREANLGKVVSEETKKKIRETKAAWSLEKKIEMKQVYREASRRVWQDPEYKKAQCEARKETSPKGEDNPMFGKSTQQLIIEKYGEEEGAVKYQEYLEKLRAGKRRLKENGWVNPTKGKKRGSPSEETRQKQREAQRKRWEKVKKESEDS